LAVSQSVEKSMSADTPNRWRSRAQEARRRFIWLAALLAMTGISSAAGLETIDEIKSAPTGDPGALGPLLAADELQGNGATVTIVSLKSASHLHDLALSTFIVDCLPGGSAVLQRTPSSGYLFVHVLAGTIRASAWKAGVGTYRAGETWVEPAFASNITVKNASTTESARTFVVRVTGR
jgi:hypothetical protein